MSDNKIFTLASECESLFQKTLAAALASNILLYRATLDCHQRFEVWAGFTGVFADEQASLDRRLMFSPNLQDGVVHLIYDCDAHMDDPATVLPGDRYAAKYGPMLAKLPPLTRTSLKGIHEAVDVLQGLAISIRRKSNSTITTRVKHSAHKFAKDDFEAVAVLLVRGLYPDAPETLARQLGFSIAFRRLRLLYQRRHEQKLQQRRDFHLEEHQDHEAQALDINVPHTVDQPQSQNTPQPTPNHMPNVVDHLSVTDHSVLQPVQTPEEASDHQSVRSGTTIISSVAQSYLYPKPPKPSEGSDYCRCNWCFEEFRADKLQRKGWWMSHFNKDLEHYTCISEECQDPPLYFASISKWQKHMTTIHTTRWTEQIHKSKLWYCDLHRADPAAQSKFTWFQSAEELRQHLEADHSQDPSPSRVAAKLRRNVMPESRKAGACPFCDFDATTAADPEDHSGLTEDLKLIWESPVASRSRVTFQACAIQPPSEPKGMSQARNTGTSTRKPRDIVQLKLSKHIGQHLKSLAFLSLRWFEEDDEEPKGSDKITSGARSWETSQDQGALSSAGSLDFDDEPQDKSDKTALRSTAQFLAALSGILNALEILESFKETARSPDHDSKAEYMIDELRMEKSILAGTLKTLMTDDQYGKVTKGMAEDDEIIFDKEMFQINLDRWYKNYPSLIENGMTGARCIKESLRLNSDFKFVSTGLEDLRTKALALGVYLNTAKFIDDLYRINEARHGIQWIAYKHSSHGPDFRPIPIHVCRLHAALERCYNAPRFDGKDIRSLKNVSYRCCQCDGTRWENAVLMTEKYRKHNHRRENEGVISCMTCEHTYCSTCPHNTPTRYESTIYIQLHKASADQERRRKSDYLTSQNQSAHIILGTGVRARLRLLSDSLFGGIGAACYWWPDRRAEPGRESVLLLDGSGYLYCLDPDTTAQSPHNSMTSLEDALSGGILTLKERVGIAGLLAHNFLLFDGSPWLSRAWDKNIYVQRQRDEPLILRMYIAVSLDAKNSAGREGLESSTSGRRHIKCYQELFQLGKVLIALWRNTSLSAPLPLPRSIREAPITPTNSITMSQNTTVYEWLSDSIFNPTYAEVVRRCISCNFVREEFDLHNPTFDEELHDRVFIPLLSVYEGMPSEDTASSDRMTSTGEERSLYLR